MHARTHTHAHAHRYIHTGDFTVNGRAADADAFNAVLAQIPLPRSRKLVVPGNHEHVGGAWPALAARLTAGTVLADAGVVAAGVRVWGAAWRGAYERVPADTDVLASHAPPAGGRDVTHTGASVGSARLAAAAARARPALLVCGHNHEGRGVTRLPDGRAVVSAEQTAGSWRSRARHPVMVCTVRVPVRPDPTPCDDAPWPPV